MQIGSYTRTKKIKLFCNGFPRNVFSCANIAVKVFFSVPQIIIRLKFEYARFITKIIHKVQDGCQKILYCLKLPRNPRIRERAREREGK